MGLFSGIAEFVTGAFAKVSNWVSSSGGGFVMAVGEEVLKGAVYGSVIGAAHSLLTGGDIKKGALRGAAMGGAAMGIAKSLTEIAGIADVMQSQTNTTDMFMDIKDPGQDLVFQSAGETVNQAPGLLDVTTKYAGKAAKSAGNFWDRFIDDEKGKILGGFAQGAAYGGLGYLTAKQQGDDLKELEIRKYQLDAEKIKNNKSGTNFSSRTANINVKKRWSDWIEDKTTQPQRTS